eukprot:1137936-Pelagomonas_calceolata.AAC.2
MPFYFSEQWSCALVGHMQGNFLSLTSVIVSGEEKMPTDDLDSKLAICWHCWRVTCPWWDNEV